MDDGKYIWIVCGADEGSICVLGPFPNTDAMFDEALKECADMNAYVATTGEIPFECDAKIHFPSRKNPPPDARYIPYHLEGDGLELEQKVGICESLGLIKFHDDFDYRIY